MNDTRLSSNKVKISQADEIRTYMSQSKATENGHREDCAACHSVCVHRMHGDIAFVIRVGDTIFLFQSNDAG